MERKPLLIASSAMLTDDTVDHCLSIGFKHVTNVPINLEFIDKVLNDLLAR